MLPPAGPRTPFHQEAAAAVRDVLADKHDELAASGLSANVTVLRPSEGGHEIEVTFYRGGEIVDVAAALIGSDASPRVTLDELREWTSARVTEVLNVD